jgi:hypothetical protein
VSKNQKLDLIKYPQLKASRIPLGMMHLIKQEVGFGKLRSSLEMMTRQMPRLMLFTNRLIDIAT